MVDGGAPYAPGGLAVGSQIAGYRVEEQIGRGGMAVVYRAADLRLNRVVALKILAPELARDAAFRERFIREMRAASAVDHPHIVPVFDAGEANGALYIAMLYASGHDVRTLISTARTLPADRVADIVSQVASALDAAHARGLIHRDVKPANMLLAEAGGSGREDHVYLSDFGLSKQSFSAASLTLTGQFLGTLDYMAPEQVEGSPIDGRADLYGLACATYEMFTGAPPFKRDHDFAAIWAQLSASAPSLLSKRPDLSPAADQVVTKALAKSPDDRYPTCGDFAGALRAACGLAQAPAEPAGRPAAVGASPLRPPTQPAYMAGRSDAAAGQPAVPQPPLIPAGQAGQPSGPPPSLPTVPQRPLMPSPAADAQAPPWPPADTAARPLSWPPYDAGGPPMSWPPPGQAGQPGPETSWPASFPARQDDLEGYFRPAPAPAGAGRRRSRPRAPLIVGCIVLLAIIGVAALLLRGGSRPASGTGTGTATGTGSGTGQGSSGSGHQPGTGSAQPPGSGTASPASTVQAYVNAINDHDYTRAWDLGGKNLGMTYQSFVQGFNGTANDDLTIVSVSGDVVTVRLAATQTDGTVKHFQGTYTVSNGVITASRIQSAS